MSIESASNNSEQIDDKEKAEMMARAADELRTEEAEARQSANLKESLAAEIYDSRGELESLSNENLLQYLANYREAQQEAADRYNGGSNELIDKSRQHLGIKDVRDEFEFWGLKRELAEEILKKRNIPLDHTLPPYLKTGFKINHGI